MIFKIEHIKGNICLETQPQCDSKHCILNKHLYKEDGGVWVSTSGVQLQHYDQAN